jgi:hypothetical protein
VETGYGNPRPPEFYSPAFGPLMEFLEREGQPESVKITVVRGLQNAALYGGLNSSQNTQLANRLIVELDKPNAFEKYQELLCETLASIDQVFDAKGEPFIAHALGRALFDHRRSLCARTAAAKAIGRVKLSPAIDLNVLAFGMVDLSRQIVEARNQKGQHLRRWCVFSFYFAFMPKNAAEKAAHAGLLERVEEPSFRKYKKIISEAYQVIRPMIGHALKKPEAPFPKTISDPILEWLKSNTPPQLRLVPTLPPLASTQLTKAEPARNQ